jgi:hypothetical protein
MKAFLLGIILAIGCLIVGAALDRRLLRYESKPDIVIEQSRISEEGRRDNYLMPAKDSQPWKDWVAKYGDTAESWELFTLGFHSKYMGELNARITKLEKAGDPNEPRQAP